MSEKLTTIIFDAATGETSERPFTEEEIARLAEMQAEQAQRESELEAKALARQSALAKLAALGLTQEEIDSL